MTSPNQPHVSDESYRLPHFTLSIPATQILQHVQEVEHIIRLTAAFETCADLAGAGYITKIQSEPLGAQLLGPLDP